MDFSNHGLGMGQPSPGSLEIRVFFPPGFRLSHSLTITNYFGPLFRYFLGYGVGQKVSVLDDVSEGLERRS